MEAKMKRIIQKIEYLFALPQTFAEYALGKEMAALKQGEDKCVMLSDYSVHQ